MPSAHEIEPSGFDGPGAGKRGAHVRSQAGAIAEAATGMRRRTEESKSFRGRAASEPPRKERKQPAKADGPTPERLKKGDLVRTTGGQMVAEGGLDRLRRTFRREDVTTTRDILARLHHRASLNDDPGMSERMYQAGKRYEEVAYLAGLSGIAAQNLLSAGGGCVDPAHMMPAGEAAAGARQKIRSAWAILPDEVAQAIHALLIEGMSVEAIGAKFSNYSGTPQRQAAGLMLLRIGLSMLVAARWA